METKDNDIFIKACLLASDEVMIITYRIDQHIFGRMVLTHNIKFMTFKKQQALKKIFNSIYPYIKNCHVETLPNPFNCVIDYDTIDRLLHLQESDKD